MFLWIAAGYVLSAIVFYSYIIKTAQEDPHEALATLAETTDRQWSRDQSSRRAA